MGELELSSSEKKFTDKYTINDKETDKILISKDAFSQGEQMEKIYNGIKELNFRLSRLR